MRPTLDEELAGIRRILAEDVAPAVEAEYPAAQLNQVLIALERLRDRLHRVSPELEAENLSLAEVLSKAAHVLATNAGGTSIAARIGAELAGPGVTAPSFDAIRTRNQRLRALLAETIAALEQRDDSDAIRARDEIRKTMRANLDRALSTGG